MVLEVLRRHQACLNVVCADVPFVKGIDEMFYDQHNNTIHFVINVQQNNQVTQNTYC